MKADFERLSPTSVKFQITVPFEEMSKSFDTAYDRIAKQINIPGFRKGKIPTRIIDQRVGRGAVIEEALNDAIPTAYEQAIREQSLYPVGRPVVDVTEIAEECKVSAMTIQRALDKFGLIKKRWAFQ